jgi:hypothetical protein
MRLLLPCLIALALIASVGAAPSQPAGLHLTPTSTGLELTWQGAPDAADLEAVTLNGLRLPGRLIAVYGTPTPRVSVQESVPYTGPLPTLAKPPLTPTELRVRDMTPEAGALPHAPLTLLRTGQVGGASITVFAFSPLFAGADGAPRLATRLRATLPDAVLYDPQGTSPPAARLRTADAPPAPADLPNGPAAVAFVTQSGLQTISGAALQTAGFNLSTLDPSRLHVHRAGTPVALELSGVVNNRLTAQSELRFFAPPPGDRWNSADRYWISLGAAPGLRMGQRTVAPGTAALRSTAIETGVWRDPQLYDSTQDGPLGDHFFAADLRSGPGAPPARLSVPLSGLLPPASGTMQLTLSGAAYTAGPHTLELQGAGGTATIAWANAGNWEQRATLPVASAVELTLPAGAAVAGVLPQQIVWERPTRLEFGGRGAFFTGTEGVWRYQVSGLPAAYALYDVSEPLRPTRLTGLANATFEDGPAPRRYLLAGPGTLFSPQVQALTPGPLPQPAAALYIAPAGLHAALEPLIAHRRAQGHTAAVVDPQALYDRWSGGQMDPEAIRSFLRWARATWPTPPQSVTLVGDGTYDPRDYLGRGSPTLIPPYLADVDRWLGETACDNCYAQLDGADPLDDPLPDLAIGRLPVKTADELDRLVAKLIAYETASGGLEWRSRAVLLADDADSGGDYAALAEAAAPLLPEGMAVQRLYFGAPSAFGEQDAGRARERTLAALNAGAGLLIYSGHGSHWQWATTDATRADGYLLGLYDPDSLTNGARLPIVLAMTCLSSSFHQAAFSGTTVDERLVLHAGGGAAAVWGSTGLGVAYGHEALQRGFLAALRAAPAGRATLGDLTGAGLRELFTNGGCCQDALRTFTLLGDPLTPVRVSGAKRVYVPLAGR